MCVLSGCSLFSCRINHKIPSLEEEWVKNLVWFQGTSLQNWTHLAIGNIYSQVDVSKAAAANSSYKTIFPANLKFLRCSATAPRC